MTQPKTPRVRPRRTLRLPSHVRPESVALHFDLDPRADDFRGTARYVLTLDRAVRSIELHSVELVIDSARRLDDHDATASGVADAASEARVELHAECETIVLRFARTLPPGRVVLELSFRGAIRDDLRGLYRGSDTANPWIASQLCPTDARRFFPCFDEPGTKARYAISISAPAAETVISNSPIEKTKKLPDGRRRTVFEQTPPLSTYLLAVVVGPFESTRVVLAGKTPIRVYTLPGNRPLASFARRAARESLRRLETWFGMPHPYAKLDLVALPDFAFGAMENAGAVFFRDSVLLLDEREAAAADRLRAAETIAHELAHMWFGNLVTMAWWNDLWLNESFATWMAYEIVHDWQPGYRVWHEFIARRETALELDALSSSHPIAPPIKTADEAHENFDAITYTKGASVLRMLERYLGSRVFRAGIRRYIRAHQGEAATAGDLWRALETASKLPIERIVGPWTTRTGYPVVTVRRASERAPRPITLEQERFLLLPRKTKRGAAHRAEPSWTIPWIGRGAASTGSSRAKTTRALLGQRRQTIEVPGARPAWLYGNGDEAGFFRIDHGHDGFLELLEALAQLTAEERIGFVGHQWALVRSGRAGMATTMELLARLGGETEPGVLLAAERVLAELLRVVAPEEGEDTTERLRGWIAIHFGSQIDTLGLDGPKREPPAVTERRARALSIVGNLAGSEQLRDICHRRVREHLAGREDLPRGAEGIVLCLAARAGNRSMQDAFLRMTRNASTPQQRRRTLFALACFDTPSLRQATRDASLDESLAPAVDRATLLMQLLAQRETASATWRHLKSVWPLLETQMPPILLARLAGETARALPFEETGGIRPFFDRHPLAAGSRVLDQLEEEVAIARRYTKRAGPELSRYLAG